MDALPCLAPEDTSSETFVSCLSMASETGSVCGHSGATEEGEGELRHTARDGCGPAENKEGDQDGRVGSSRERRGERLWLQLIRKRGR